MGRSLRGTGTSVTSERASAAGDCGPRDRKVAKIFSCFYIVLLICRLKAGSSEGKTELHEVAAVNFASLVVLLAPRLFVQPTLPVRAVQAGLSTAERRGGRRSQPRSPSLAASVRRRGLPFRLPPGASAIRTSSMALGCCVGSGWPLARELSRSLAEDLAGRCIVFGAPTPPTGRAAIGIGT